MKERIDANGNGQTSTKLERGARVLREAILRGDLRPGQKLKQQELAAWLGMSATPVREVLRILEAEGLLVHLAHKGVLVADVSPAEAEEVALIRAALECLAVRMCIPNLTAHEMFVIEDMHQRMEAAWKNMDLAGVRRYNYHFHAAIYRGSGSDLLCSMIERLWPRFATDLLWMIPGRTERSIAQHRTILEAIRDRDADRAEAVMQQHIVTAGNDIVTFFKRQSGGVMTSASFPLPVWSEDADLESTL